MQLSPIVILRRVYLGIVNNNHCAAKLIEYFKHWREWKTTVQRTEWIYQPLRRIRDDLMCEHSMHCIRDAIELLIDIGILERRNNPGNGQDKTYQYRLDHKRLNELLGIEPQIETELREREAEFPEFRSEPSEFTVEQQPQIQTELLPDLLATTTASAAVEKEVVEEEVSQEEQREIDSELRRLRINPSDVRRDIKRHRSNLSGAIIRVKKALSDGWCQNPTGLLKKTLKEGLLEDFQPVAPKEYPHPTMEQLNELGTLGTLVNATLNEPGYPGVLAVDTGSAVVLWWVALGVSIA